MDEMMKALILVTLLASPVMADDFCTNMYSVGKSVMTARQNGVPLPEMMKLLESTDLVGTMQPIIVEAYSHPVYTTQSIRKRTIDEFANSLHLECLKAE
jgi:hypothetical protein